MNNTIQNLEIGNQMTSPTTIHHINFIVEDLEASVERYQRLLRVGPFEFADLPDRSVSTARVLLGETWLVLVSPTHKDSVPGRYLKQRGEGFFLLSFGINNLDQALQNFENHGLLKPNSTIRQGIMDWRVIDLQTEDLLGANFHLTEVNTAIKESR